MCIGLHVTPKKFYDVIRLTDTDDIRAYMTCWDTMHVMRTALLWVITQRLVEISSGRFGQPIGPNCRGPEFGTRYSVPKRR